MIRKMGFAPFVVFFFALVCACTSARAQSHYTGRYAHAQITGPIDNNNLVTLAGNTRPEARPEYDRGRVDHDFRMDHMFLLLKNSADQQADLQQFTDDLQNPNSPNFHQWITAAQFGERFGLAGSDIDAITDWLQSYGFKINVVYPNGLLIDFSGTARQVHEAFHTEIHRLHVRDERHIANMSDPQIPAALAPAISGIVSLHDFLPNPLYQLRRSRDHFDFHDGDNKNNNNAHPVAPADLATIYNLNPLFNAGVSGQGQTIVVVEDSNVFRTSDWNTFRSTFGLSNYKSGSLSTVHPAPAQGSNNCFSPGVVAPNDAEATLDAEWASAAAPNAAIVVAACADSSTTFGGLIALQNLINTSGQPPSIVSLSYGQCETKNGAAANAAYFSTYQQAVTEGVSVFVAAGSNGASACSVNGSEVSHGMGVNAFASTPFNVAVGGTDFSDTFSGSTSTYWNSSNHSSSGSAKSYIPEIPWNDSCAGSLLATSKHFNLTYGPTSLCNDFPIGFFFLNTGASGGGPSACATGQTSPWHNSAVSGSCAGWPKPAWQSIVGNPTDGVRDLPDVSLFSADGLWGHFYVFCWSDVYNGGSFCNGSPSNWSGAGGTSFASPIMAGIQALINQKAGGPQGNPNPVFYQLASAEYGGGGNSSCNASNGNNVGSSCIFYDITQGDTTVDCRGRADCFYGGGEIGVLSTSTSAFQPAFLSTTGWDFATGIGSINATNLVNNWPGSGVTAPAPGFSLSVSPATLSVVQGASGTSTVTVLPQNGFSGSVNLSASGLPAGVTASFNPNPSTGASTLTLAATSSAATGTSTITISGASASLTNSSTLSLTVNPAAPPPPPPTFTLSAAPGSLTLVQGNSGTSTLTIAPQNGFKGSVTFSASGLPSGVTASFSPNPATGTSTMTLNAGSTAAVGTTGVTITGTSGSLSIQATILLTINAFVPPPNFSLSANPNSLSIMQGFSGGTTISIAPQNGFAGSVTLSTSGLPTGVTASFSPNPTSGMSTLTLNASGTATTGTGNVTITGTSSSLSNSTTLSLTVVAAPPPNFTLSAAPTALTVVQGGTATSSVTIGSLNGFAAAVNLSASGLPGGVFAFFTPASATTSSQVTFSANGSATPGTTTVTISGSSGSLTNTTTVSLTVSTNTALSTLPAVWSDGDIGATGVSGSSSYSDNVFTVIGAGSQIYGSVDAFHFLSQPLSGDGSIVARLLSVSGATGNGSAGVMIRDTLDPASDNAKTADWPTFGGIFFDVRATSGGSSTEPGSFPIALPYWIKLTRAGSTFSSFVSMDGVNWVQIGSSQTITMGQNVNVGLAVTSGSTASTATATFDNVSVNSASAPTPVIASVSATTGTTGSQVTLTGSNFGASQSDSVVLLNDSLVGVNSWSATSISITIPAGATSGPLVVAVAPSMTASNPVVFTVTPQPLPASWLDQDVGSVGIAGNASSSNGTFSVTGAGAQIYGTADAFHFVYQPLSGDGTLIARLVAVQGGMGNASAGVMIRNTLDTSSVNAKTADWPSFAGIFFDFRATAGGLTTEPATQSATLPYWVKIVRSGSNFSSFVSADGTTWVQLGSSQSISMGQNVYIGLSVTSGDTASTATATFDNVALTTP
jgi:Pro-kumamolisin, activation domain/IPT/TIG domain